MESRYIEFTDHSDPENIRNIILNMDEVTCVEKTTAIGNVQDQQQVNYVIALYTRNNILGKKSQCLALYFDEAEERDQVYETIHAKLAPVIMEGKWHVV